MGQLLSAGVVLTEQSTAQRLIGRERLRYRVADTLITSIEILADDAKDASLWQRIREFFEL